MVKTEEVGLALLLDKLPKFYVPDLNEKHQVLNWLGIDSKFIRAFDGLLLEVRDFQEISGSKDFSLIEVKVTKKYLPDLSRSPKGFFSVSLRTRKCF